MAEFIRLAEWSKGAKAKRLTIREKEYIDDNFKYEPIATMAKHLNLTYNDVGYYCDKMRYQVVNKLRAKPKKLAKESIFDVDNYKQFSI